LDIKNIKTNINTAEYSIDKYKFVVDSKFDEKGRKIDDILIELAVKDLTKAEMYCKIDL